MLQLKLNRSRFRTSNQVRNVTIRPPTHASLLPAPRGAGKRLRIGDSCAPAKRLRARHGMRAAAAVARPVGPIARATTIARPWTIRTWATTVAWSTAVAWSAAVAWSVSRSVAIPGASTIPSWPIRAVAAKRLGPGVKAANLLQDVGAQQLPVQLGS